MSTLARTISLCLLLSWVPLQPGAALADSASGPVAPLSAGRSDLRPLGAVAVRSMPQVDVAALLEEDEANRERVGIPYRVGYPQPSDLSPANSGTWEVLPDGGSLWRLKVRSPGALWLSLGFGTFRPAEGVRMWVYDPARSEILGPYGEPDIRSHGQLWLPPLNGETAVIEIHQPRAVADATPNIHLGTVSHGYKSWGGYGEFAFSPAAQPGEEVELASGACNIDVNCPLGDDWQDQKRGVARLLIGGSGLCSGSLIGTTANDCRPYFLTARHCISSQSAAASTVFRFNYERPLCNSGVPATNEYVSGSVLLASYGDSDMTLLQLDESPAASFGAYFSGWSRSSAAASESTGIHHPGGDYKKICYNADPLIDGQSYGSDHWRVTEWEAGTTEGGSSGSPLFDQDQRIVGQLHGGTASCSSLTYDEYGKLDVSWWGGGSSSTRLRDWLDPLGSGQIVLDGLDHSLCLVPRPLLSYVWHSWVERVGNGNGALDPGEAIHIEAAIENGGTLNATDVTGLLGGAGPLLGISRFAASWPDIPMGEIRASAGPGFDVELDPGYPCGEPLRLTLELSAAESAGPWSVEIEIPTGSPLVDEHFRDDMEAGLNGWTSEPLIGTDAWTRVTTHSASPAHSWFIADPLSRRDTALVMPLLEQLPPNSMLGFAHRFDTEANRDGGVLEYSIDSGASWLDAGPLIVEGGYNSNVGSGESSPLAGRPLWSGDSGGWQTTRVDLGSLAGSDVALRWRFATNLLGADDGWYVDDVVVDTTSFACETQSLVPGETSDPLGSAESFLIRRDGGEYELSWSAPVAGGAAMEYRLYAVPLGGGVASPACEANLGSALTARLATLPDDRGFLVVARNSLGEGSYGRDSDGLERSPAQGGAICP